jgi:hypothetical protein
VPRTPTVPAAVRHPVRPLAAALVTVVTATLALAFLAGPAWAGSPPRGGPARDGVGQDGPQVHHVSPENGAVLRTAPDHFEIMFDVELVPGRVAVGIAPAAWSPFRRRPRWTGRCSSSPCRRWPRAATPWGCSSSAPTGSSAGGRSGSPSTPRQPHPPARATAVRATAVRGARPGRDGRRGSCP